MNSIVLEHINDLFDPYDLFSGRGKKIRSSIITTPLSKKYKHNKQENSVTHS